MPHQGHTPQPSRIPKWLDKFKFPSSVRVQSPHIVPAQLFLCVLVSLVWNNLLYFKSIWWIVMCNIFFCKQFSNLYFFFRKFLFISSPYFIWAWELFLLLNCQISMYLEFNILLDAIKSIRPPEWSLFIILWDV